MKKEDVIYEPHPVTPERKAELRKQGYRIIDARFKPDDWEEPKSEDQGQKDVAKMTVDELKTLLDERGIEYPSDAKKAYLQELAQ
ncbi:hypothetical protein KRX19_05580 [Cardiobacteriaceae bacterium TAE3-ERU3]|nr:hypothetical protein [Cardiobacteriaceae bacterium TAE3-ERU3]